MALFGRNTSNVDVVDVEPEAPVAAPAPVVVPTRRSLEEEREFLLRRVNALRPFGMQIWDVPGLVLCEDIVSDLDLPLVTTTRIAGWGVRGSDLVGARPGDPRRLFLVDSISVSDGVSRPLVAGAVIEIEKGAIVPDGVDAVLPPSAGTLAADGYVDFETETRLYQNLRRAGSELADGTPLLRAGEVLTPRSVAVLAEVGLDKVLARPRPRIVVFTVGETLVAPGRPLTAPQQRYDAATALLTSAARADGATVYPLGIVESSPEVVRQTIADQQIRADLIVVVGGGDLVRDAVASLGEVDEAEVAINGEARVTYAGLGAERTPLLSLPSGVVSSYVAYHALVRPVINKLNDVDPLGAPRVQARLADRLESSEGITHFVPGVLDAEGVVRAVAGTDSELAWDLARANVLALIPEHWGGAEPGSLLECLVLDDAHTPPAAR
ncbi:MAG: molybdopterin-binding protein [Propioniciclava sp.]|uniref:molybdopterin molybdotransferase MoeA n=1 Tax=Propioniciclava sp. TaxID=2038686 RepID=UPI0039E3BBCB